jgi:hypothetical protein
LAARRGRNTVPFASFKKSVKKWIHAAPSIPPPITAGAAARQAALAGEEAGAVARLPSGAQPAPRLVEDDLFAGMDASSGTPGFVETERDRLIRLVRSRCLLCASVLCCAVLNARRSPRRQLH